ncbi:MAG: ADP-ribosylglycohydrolase family protein [Anaerolineales bacterium]|nr:ADP-ribosylglycohydrolase family protein [Anaerolineales bacterium]
MTYPNQNIETLRGKLNALNDWAALQHEYGAKGIAEIIARVEREIETAIDEIRRLPIDMELAVREPNDLAAIRALRPDGPRRLWHSFDETIYADRLEGALLGRFAGCTLGAPVEFWPIDKMWNLARENGMDLPPLDYWKYVPEPYDIRYAVSPREAYTRDKMKGVPVDDDVTYTLLGLLILEDFGPNFTTEDVGAAWLKYLPYACTAEDIALRNLKKGIPARQAGEVDNPFCEWIGADIRSDPWGYLAPGLPEVAAEMAWRDAFLSHRRQGIYGEMYFSAVIAAAFAVDDPVEALHIGLTEIPRDCALAKAVRWALDEAPRIQHYRQARAAAETYCEGMSGVHTIINALLTIWGITMHGTDFSKVIGEVMSMGLDNDCTAATAGSIVGAVVGKRGLPEHWYRPFENTVYTYMIDHPEFKLDDVAVRFARQARRVFAYCGATL